MDQSIYERIDQLTQRINELARQQTSISQQLVQLINELDALKRTVEAGEAATYQPKQRTTTVVETVIETPKPTPRPIPAPAPVPQRSNAGFEEFVGKNLASKVGILVTIIGIFIGAKYA